MSAFMPESFTSKGFRLFYRHTRYYVTFSALPALRLEGVDDIAGVAWLEGDSGGIVGLEDG